MKAFEALIEEVYQDDDLRQEFLRYAQLKAKQKARVKQMSEKATPLTSEGQMQFVNYEELTQTTPNVLPEERELRKGLFFLSSSLLKTLSQRYQLTPEEAKKLREAVVVKYEQLL